MQRVRIERSAMIEASFGNFVGVVVDASCSSKSVPKFFDLWGVRASPLMVSQIQERQGTPPPPFLFSEASVNASKVKCAKYWGWTFLITKALCESLKNYNKCLSHSQDLSVP